MYMVNISSYKIFLSNFRRTQRDREFQISWKTAISTEFLKLAYVDVARKFDQSEFIKRREKLLYLNFTHFEFDILIALMSKKVFFFSSFSFYICLVFIYD